MIQLTAQLDPSLAPDHPVGGYCVEALTPGGTVISHGHLTAARVLRMLEDADTAGVREAAMDELRAGRDQARARAVALDQEVQDARALDRALTADALATEQPS